MVNINNNLEAFVHDYNKMMKLVIVLFRLKILWKIMRFFQCKFICERARCYSYVVKMRESSLAFVSIESKVAHKKKWNKLLSMTKKGKSKISYTKEEKNQYEMMMTKCWKKQVMSM